MSSTMFNNNKIDSDESEKQSPGIDLESSRSVEDFLERERLCTQTDEVELENIFKELNRLQSNQNMEIPTNRDIDDILSEAESLVLKRVNNKKVISPKIELNVERKSLKKFSKSEDRQDREKELRDVLSKAENPKPISDCEVLPGAVSRTFKETVLRKSLCDCEELSQRHVNALQEELKDTTERLKSLELHHQQLQDTNRQGKHEKDQLTHEKLGLEAKLSKAEDDVFKMKKDLERIGAESNAFEKEIEKLREETGKLRQEKNFFSSQAQKDKLVMQDLQRQCKEMETILLKRHPDSVSALIVTSKHPALESNTKTLLENRITQLENELKEEDQKHHDSLTAVQEKVASMKTNYETHISDLEKQVHNLQEINLEMVEANKQRESHSFGVQTESVGNSVGVQTRLDAAKPSSAKSGKATSGESHLMATVRGLNVELVAKEKCIGKLNRDLEDLKRQLAKVQKSKDVFTKVQPGEKPSRGMPSKTSNSKSLSLSANNLQLETSCNKENQLAVGRSGAEVDSLRRELAVLQGDYDKLKNKRIQDLFSLQSAHEKELMGLNMKVAPVQEDVDSLNRSVEILRDQIQALTQQLALSVAERDHYRQRLQGKARGSDSERSGKGTSNEDKDYDFLKMKVIELEKRYEGRELRLKTLVESLAKLKGAQASTHKTEGSYRTTSDQERLHSSSSFLPY